MSIRRLSLATTRSRSSQLREWKFFAERYIAAASALDDANDTHILPRSQLYGHATECAFKAYLSSRNVSIPRGKAGHDLVNLASIAEDNGFYIQELQAIALAQLYSVYYKDIVTGTMYKSRYPTEFSESKKNKIGDFINIEELVNTLIIQCDN
jgi:hypothetical protein